MSRPAARRRFRQRLLVGFLVLMLVPYVRQMLISPTAGQDFKAFYASATLLARGGDPYDWQALAVTEDGLYNAPRQLRPGDRAYYDFMPLPEGPWLALGLVPLTSWPWQPAFAFFMVLMGLAIAAGAWLVLRTSGWQDRRGLALLCVVLSPVAFINLFIGQVTPLIFFAFAAGWALAAGRRPLLAGLALTLVWIKPNIGLVLPLVVVLLEPSATIRLAAGFALGTGAAFAGAWVTVGAALLHWPVEIIQHWHALQGPQPDVASVHAFYYVGLAGWAKSAALAVVMVALAAYAVVVLRRAAGRHTAGLTVLLLWILALPYVHSLDTLLLLPVTLALLEPGLQGWSDVRVELTIWAFALLPLVYFLGARIGYFNGFGAIAVALCAIAWHHRRLRRSHPVRLERAA